MSPSRRLFVTLATSILVAGVLIACLVAPSRGRPAPGARAFVIEMGLDQRP